jgi:hypothetical protein
MRQREEGSGSVGANLSLSGTVSIDGQGTVSNYSVTASISQDFKSSAGGTANAGFKTSSKRGCTLSGKVEQNFQGGFADDVKKASENKYGATMTEYLKPEDALKQSLWSGEYKLP